MGSRRELARMVVGALAGIGLSIEILLDATHAPAHGRPVTYGFAASVGLACVGLRLRSLGAQLAGRAIVSFVLFVAGSAAILFGRADAALAAVLAAVTLLGVRDPWLRSEEALAFSPVAHRRTFLAGLMATYAVAFVLFLVAGLTFTSSAAGGAAGVAALSIAALLVASGAAILRMRAWGVFGAAAAAVALVVLGAATYALVPMSVLALGPLLVVAPVLHARLFGTLRRQNGQTSVEDSARGISVE